ncbi:MAG: glycine cleavage system protein GcvH [Deltaproteobacteria bacterium]|nr:glycine cleavage system protein GcvH [Deltaproteobacteria bacterium]MBW2283457.1 glycine cleavage system protein GcvH [Deltaproteobacteria bacterium]
MKEIEELDLPEDIRYAKSHEWARPADGTVRVGIDDYAQDQLGDIVFVELPQVGDALRRGEEFGTIESVKAVAEVFLPVGGKVVSVNTQLEDSPDLVNRSPYENGWMVEIEPADPSELEGMMGKDAYLDMLKGME